MKAHDVSTNNLILFDGVCNLCNGAVQFVIKHDKKGIYSFASLQSELGKNIIKNAKKPISDSILLIQEDEIYQKSSAALRIAKQLNGLFPLLYIFMIVPKFIRDWVYDWVARNRYRWFGKEESCWLPTPELQSRFLDLA